MLKKINIWGRSLDLNVDFDLYEGEEVLEEQKTRLEDFVENVNLSDVTFIKEYCAKHNGSEVNATDSVFDYLSPKTLFVPRSGNKKIVAVLCDYKFDEEHGIAVVYENGIFSEIGEQDIVL